MRRERILILIEDNELRNDVSTILKEYSVDAVAKGEHAIEMCKVYQYSLIITDINLSSISGIEFIKFAKEINKDTGIIVLSNENEFRDTVTALQYGALNFFTKPIKLDDVLNGVREIFKMRAILDKTRKIDYYLLSTKKTYVIPNDINLISDLASTLSRDLMLSGVCTETEILNIDLSLVEMITNSIEHGNLEISYEEKAELIENDDDAYLLELKNRSKMKPYSDRMVKVEAYIDHAKVEFCISDEGKGFDFKKYTKNKKQDALKISGRGVIMTKAVMDEVTYTGNGNRVTLVKYFKNKK